ncbi:hypothetical protein AE618_13035 [Bosea vaviloviae]|uniref:Uncharacterized protein n=2 Tax=Bosea vaviloviae TaxID=1526658 RepID=A0A0N0MBA6_9HYPH|nr:hypothetical protein AE618_13035 [Bosea vaviloviae]
MVMAHDPGFRMQIGQADASGAGNPVPAPIMLTATREFAQDLGERIAITAAMALLVVVQFVVGAIVWTGLGIAWLLGKRG